MLKAKLAGTSSKMHVAHCCTRGVSLDFHVFHPKKGPSSGSNHSRFDCHLPRVLRVERIWKDADQDAMLDVGLKVVLWFTFTVEFFVCGDRSGPTSPTRRITWSPISTVRGAQEEFGPQITVANVSTTGAIPPCMFSPAPQWRHENRRTTCTGSSTGLSGQMVQSHWSSGSKTWHGPWSMGSEKI